MANDNEEPSDTDSTSIGERPKRGGQRHQVQSPKVDTYCFDLFFVKAN